MSEDRVLAALRTLREADEGREAAAGVEARLMRAFRRRGRKRKVLAWAAVGAAAGIAAGLAGVWIEMSRPAERMVVVAPVPVPPVAAVSEPKAPPILREPARRRVEVVTQFFPLMDTPPPFERGEVLRVSLPASAVQRAGFPIEGSGSDDSVEADVLVGEEGLARAIRFVSYQK